MKKVSFLIIMSFLMLVSNTFADELIIQDFAISPVETREISVELNNVNNSFIAFDFNLNLPDGINVKTQSNGNLDVVLNSSRSNGHILEIEKNEDGSYHFLCYSTQNNVIKGNEGEIISIAIIADISLNINTVLQGTLFDQILIDKDRNGVEFPDSYFSTNIISTPSYVHYYNGVLTFYHDTERSTREGNIYNIPTANTTPDWIASANNIMKVVFDSSFAEELPTSTYQWFDGMTNLSSIEGIEYLNTSEVTSMYCMFNKCANLQKLDLSHFDTRKVTSMTAMMAGCTNLKEVNLEGFNTSAATSIRMMFQNCSSLTSVDLSSFDLTKCTDIRKLFEGCTSLEAVDFSNFNVQPGTNTTNLLYNCSALRNLALSLSMEDIASTACKGVGTLNDPCTISVPDGFDFGVDTSGSSFLWKSGYFYIPPSASSYVHFNNGELTFYHDNARTNREGSIYDLPSKNVTPEWIVLANAINKVKFDSSFAVERPKSTKQWFDGMTNLSTIEGMENLNTSDVTSMYCMFRNCTSLKAFNPSNFNLSICTDISNMFEGCTALESVDFSCFNIQTGTNSTNLLFNCSSLKSLVLSDYMEDLAPNACQGVGSKSSPCKVSAPEWFNFGVDNSGEYFIWKDGYFYMDKKLNTPNKIVFADLGLENGVQYSEPFDGGTFTVTFTGGQNDGKYYNTGNAIRMYSEGSMIVEAKTGNFIKVVVTFGISDRPNTANVVDTGSFDPATGVWTGYAPKITFTRPQGSGHWKVEAVEVFFENEATMPTISGITPFSKSITVTITPSKEDLTIYYTIDGSNPKLNTHKVYNGPFTLTETTTVKAVEQDSKGNFGNVAMKTFVKNEIPDLPIVANIAAFKALEDGTEAILTLNGAQVLYAGKHDIYVRDASGAIDFYVTGFNLNNGQFLSGSIAGKKYSYLNKPELMQTENTYSDGITATQGTATPKVLTIVTAKSSQFYCDLVRLDNVYIAEDYFGRYYAYIGTDSIQIYNQFNIGMGDFNYTDTYTVEGILVPRMNNFEILITQPLSKSISAFDPGDVNHDGVVNVTDVMATIQYILGTNPPNYDESLADMNNDGNIDVTDAMAMVLVILDSNVSGAPACAITSYETLTLAPNANGFDITTAGEFTACQMTVTLPEGGSISNVSTTAGGKAFVKRIADNRYNVVVYSQEGMPLTKDGSFIQLRTRGNTNGISIDNIQLTDRTLNTIILDETNGIIEIANNEQSGDFYNIQGMKVKTPNRGIYIRNGKKQTVK